MYFVYIIQSTLKSRYYTGSTKDLEARLLSHNSGSNKSTKPYRPWKIVYTEICVDKQTAIKREFQIKSYKGGRAFKALLQ